MKAVVIDGHLAFVPADTDIFGEPDCINAISIRASQEANQVNDIPEDAVFWEKNFHSATCENKFPVKYGARLHGEPWPDLRDSEVDAKPLQIGEVYVVETRSEGSAYGSGKFTITAERKIVNLPF